MRNTVRLFAAVLAAVCALILANPTIAAAAPEQAPPAGTTSTTAGNLPKGFPNELKQFVGGTDEFKNGPWFKGTCANRGGDFGAYLAAMYPKENQLRYWSLSADDKAGFLIGQNLAVASATSKPLDSVELSVNGKTQMVAGKDKIAEAITNGAVPANPATYGKTFPNDNPEFYPPAPTCADDLASWTSKASTTWGFDWAKSPDAASQAAMKKAGAPDAAVTDPCGMTGKGAWAYCSHAMFVNCDKVNRADDNARCLAWNTSVGRMFSGTKDWIDRNTSFSDRFSDGLDKVIRATPQYIAVKATVDAFSSVYQLSKKVVEFVKDPGGIIDDWANALKSWAVSTTNAVLRGLVSVGDFDASSSWFIEQYAIAEGIGVFVMAIMLILVAMRSGRPRGGSGGPRELMGIAFGYMPAGLLAMMFAPAFILFLQPLSHGLTDFFSSLIGSKTDEVVNNVSATLGGLTKDTLIGGSIAGILAFGLLGFGAFVLFVGLLMHQIGMPLAGVVSAICWGMWINPKWRAKALRPGLMFISLMFSTPLLFLLIGVIEDIINSAAKSSVTGGGDLKSLGQLALLAMAFFALGLAPFALLKWAPILPSAEDADKMGGGGAGSGSIAGAGMGAGLAAASSPGRSVGSGGATNVAAASGGAHSAGNSSPGGATPAGSHSMPSATGGGGGGGHHGAAGGKAAGMGGKAMAGGKAGAGMAASAGTGTAAALGMAAQGGSKAAAISAMNRIHGSASDAAPETQQ